MHMLPEEGVPIKGWANRSVFTYNSSATSSDKTNSIANE